MTAAAIINTVLDIFVAVPLLLLLGWGIVMDKRTAVTQSGHTRHAPGKAQPAASQLGRALDFTA